MVDMSHKILFIPSGKMFVAEDGMLISEASKTAGIDIELPCGGKGKCGKCLVSVSDPEAPNGSMVLACQTHIEKDMTISLPEKEGKIAATSDHRSVKVDKISPLVKFDGDINYGLAVDIGTTTIAVSILDMNGGLDLYSAVGKNRQRLRGEDVLTRIQYAEDGGTEELRKLVIDSINDIIDICLDKRCSPNSVRSVYISGNTAMTHLFLGIDPSPIRVEPYEPVVKEAEITGKESGLSVNPLARVVCMPSLSSYVGGDVTSGVVASGMDKNEKMSLLIDVGTNGEVVIGDKDMILACSSSAGPAFEGGGVTSGMLAMSGAIDSVRIIDGKMTFTVIASSKPKGICGSGLIDAIAEMLRSGWIDKKGNFTDLAPVITDDQDRYIKIADDVVITQDDVNAILLTKAAIYSAAESLVRNVSLSINDMDKIYIAGGFGNFIDLENAISIGLFPDVPRERYVYMGNASLAGAKLALLSASFRARIIRTFKRMTYLDLGSDPTFFNEYSSAQFFPHTDASRFPSVRL